MRMHYLQHVPFEDSGMIAEWAQDRGHSISCTRLFANESLPAQDDFDWLVILGGPMNIYKEEDHPWLPFEKAFIRDAIQTEHLVLGLCLGAQLLADVFGGPATRNPTTSGL